MALIKTEQEINKMRKAGALLGAVLSILKKEAKPGIRLIDLDRIAFRMIQDAGARPSFLGYRPDGATRPYPATLCASVNDTIVHGVPSGYALKKGDILKIDLGVIWEGYHADAAVTVPIDVVSETAQKLITATEEGLARAIKKMVPGNTLGDVGYEIQSIARAYGFSVAKGLTGHAIGSRLHEDPPVWNEADKGKGRKLEAGMVFALEPMFTVGSGEIIQKEDESYGTKDKSLSAHFEHTVLVTKTLPEILTPLL
ncbi:MAG: type I methionyl aminopeptidase [Patescibacteria group bacterium]